ncbi:MAG: amino acid-binding protein [Nigerium sp.]|nr:amino acid-binding protein [Nigerium sp.]
MYLLRVIIPDRPGSLGAVATALGLARADINAVEIVEKGHGFVIDDFMLTLPSDARPDTLVSACAALADVEVMWVSVYPDNWGLSGDIDVLEQMVTVPERAEEVLADLAPATFHCSWALIVDRDSGQVVHRSSLAPVSNVDVELVGDLASAHVCDLAAGWQDGWGEHAIAVAPFRDDHSIIVGRPGPPFRTTELARLKHLALLAGEHEHI